MITFEIMERIFGNGGNVYDSIEHFLTTVEKIKEKLVNNEMDIDKSDPMENLKRKAVVKMNGCNKRHKIINFG